MNYILFEDSARDNLLPLTYTRPVAEIRIGILKISEKWDKHLQSHTSFLTAPYLSEKFPVISKESNILVNGSLLPSSKLAETISELGENEALVRKGTLIAVHLDEAGLQEFNPAKINQGWQLKTYEDTFIKIDHPYHIFQHNDQAIRNDFELLTKGRTSAEISATNQVICPENIFAEEDARIECAILNGSTGPIYIGHGAEIMEGSIVRGALALCDHSTLKLGAKIYGPTTIGPHSKVGGEVNNSVIFGFSNKAHDGFIGNTVIGEWCNIGADTNTSNLKNNYASVRLWNYPAKSFTDTGLTFCGLIMGDHSKCGINTMFNTGTVVGVSANVFGTGFPRNFIPSFSWGGKEGFITFKLNKVCEVAEKVMARRNIMLSDTDKAIFEHVFDQTSEFRTWDKALVNPKID